MIEYYDRRAASMDAAYAGQPHPWVLEMVADLQDAVRGRRVLDVACGSGHWTRYAAEVASHTTGVDAAPGMLDLARGKGLAADFVLGDAYALGEVPGEFDAGMAMQWFSHVPRERHAEFLTGLHRRLTPDAVVFLADNQLRSHDNPYGKPDVADTFERRTLEGAEFEIVKNYFTADELRAILAAYAVDVTVHEGEYWWWLTYRARPVDRT
jgi:SAM-dependent methyltransferase